MSQFPDRDIQDMLHKLNHAHDDK